MSHTLILLICYLYDIPTSNNIEINSAAIFLMLRIFSPWTMRQSNFIEKTEEPENQIYFAEKVIHIDPNCNHLWKKIYIAPSCFELHIAHRKNVRIKFGRPRITLNFINKIRIYK